MIKKAVSFIPDIGFNPGNLSPTRIATPSKIKVFGDYGQLSKYAFYDELEKIAKQSHFKVLKQNQVPLTPEERSEVIKRKATWNHGPNGEPSPAVWKSVNKKTGKTTYVTHTHRAFNTAPTLKGAINRYHKFIKTTA